MKYNKILAKIEPGSASRDDLAKLRSRALEKYAAGDIEAKEVLDAIDVATPSDNYIVFMGFCPGADFDNRQDIEWREKGICRFDYIDSTHQLKRFNSIYPGDLIVLKKRHTFGKSMKLYGHGRVEKIQYDEANVRFLKVNWSGQTDVIEVPLMGANSTVDIKLMTLVNKEMPESFFQWLAS